VSVKIVERNKGHGENQVKERSTWFVQNPFFCHYLQLVFRRTFDGSIPSEAKVEPANKAETRRRMNDRMVKLEASQKSKEEDSVNDWNGK
jgi:hypothetical protein